MKFTHEDNVLYNETCTQPVGLSLLTVSAYFTRSTSEMSQGVEGLAQLRWWLK